MKNLLEKGQGDQPARSGNSSQGKKNTVHATFVQRTCKLFTLQLYGDTYTITRARCRKFFKSITVENIDNSQSFGMDSKIKYSLNSINSDELRQCLINQFLQEIHLKDSWKNPFACRRPK